MELQAKRALVTGASSGIGREIARALAGNGVALAIAARREHLLHKLADEIASWAGSSRPAVIKIDLSERGAAARLARDASAALGHIDILVNNAGGGAGGTQWSIGDRDESREAMEINYWSPLALTAAIVPEMRKRHSGYVVNITSGAQSATWPGFGAYGATKAALALATEALRLELAGTNVRVLEVVAGPIDTAVQAETRRIPGIEKMIGRRSDLGDPREMARRIVAALRADKHRLIYPKRTAIAYTFPRFIRAYIARTSAKVLRGIDAETRETLMHTVVRTGSFGDLTDLREEWERAH
jgi:short-subunit dehydrogenase